MAECALAEIADEVKELILDSLDRTGEECSLSTQLIDELDAESLDYLDIVFRIERAYSVKVQRGRIEKSLKDRLSTPLKPNTEATDELKTALKEFMPEVEPETIDGLKKVKEIASLFTVGTFVRTAVIAITETRPDTKISGGPVDGFEPWQLGVPAAAQ